MRVKQFLRIKKIFFRRECFAKTAQQIDEKILMTQNELIGAKKIYLQVIPSHCNQ